MAVESSKNSINSKQEIMERFAELSVKMTEVMKLSREIEQYMEMEQELSEQIDKMNGQKIDIPFEQYDRYCSSTDIMMNIIYNLLGSRQIS